MNATDELTQTVTDRAKGFLQEIYEPVAKAGLPQFFIGGNSLNGGEVKDIDIFPIGHLLAQFDYPDEVLSVSNNAVTCQINGRVVQLCNYPHPTLKSLVESFDYAHIQVGVGVADGEVCGLYMTDDYEAAQIIGDSWYMGSEYPLSSLIRLLKYHARGQISHYRAKEAIFKTMTDVLKRGYQDSYDFGDQLDAIDLGLVAREFPGAWGLLEAMQMFKGQGA